MTVAGRRTKQKRAHTQRAGSSPKKAAGRLGPRGTALLSPSPLVGEGRGGGSGGFGEDVPHLATPTPDPSPQGGREKKRPHPAPANLPPHQGGEPNAADLLAWYDRHRRRLPWRALPGETPDPYRVWLSEIMLQQTTVTAVMPYYLKFLARFPCLPALAAADIDDVLSLWAGLGYYARARNLHACARAVAARGGFPDTEDELATLPGIGPYTAAAIAAIAFDRKAAAVDGNVERVVTRLFAIEEPLPDAKPAIRAFAARLVPDRRAGDFAQAMMDLGATICTPKAPACVLCPFIKACAASRRGDAESFPRRAKKREGQLRRGAAYVAIRADGHVLVRRRASRGLLGGMTEVPTTEWHPDFDVTGALADAPRFDVAEEVAWRRVAGVVNHVFTHFPLELAVFIAQVPQRASQPDGTWWLAPDEIADAAFPSLMRKVLAHARVTPTLSKRQPKRAG
jgi:A/G-specific adenine glycosylase